MQNGARVQAKRILFAAGYESLDYLDHDVGQFHSTFALASEPVRDFNKQTNQCLIWETARPYFYFRNTVDERIIVGGMDTEFEGDHARNGMISKKAKQLEHRFSELFTGRALAPSAAWAGIFGDTKDGLAYIGSPPEHPQAYFALGYGGNGITFSIMAAKIITDLYLGRPNPDACIFRFGR
jgi:glycine/D-amino acid oxidase-like deaminating enzyme